MSQAETTNLPTDPAKHSPASSKFSPCHFFILQENLLSNTNPLRPISIPLLNHSGRHCRIWFWNISHRRGRDQQTSTICINILPHFSSHTHTNTHTQIYIYIYIYIYLPLSFFLSLSLSLSHSFSLSLFLSLSLSIYIYIYIYVYILYTLVE